SKTISIDNIKEGYIFAYANEKEFTEFLKLNLEYEVLVPPSLQKPITESLKSAQTSQWTHYPTFDEYINMMQDFENNYPGLCKVHEIGQSVNGREILLVKISDNVIEKESEPGFMYSSTMHGDEVAGYVLMLRLIDYLLNNYESDDYVKYLVDNIEIWINPIANPDGTYFSGNNTIFGATRNNANGIDLNRNFPDPQDGQHPDDNPWQPEVIAMMDFIKEHQFVLSANIHGGTEVVNYPWDTWEQRHVDDLWFQYISHQYADTAQYYSWDGYMTILTGSGIINGYDWYSISGGRQDYVTWFLHGREVTLEISGDKIPDTYYLDTLWEFNYRSFLNYMEQCLFGISGIIIDSISGEPLKAQVFIQNHDDEMSFVYSDSVNGNYHRLLAAGNYNMLIEAEGYTSKVLNNIEVSWNENTQIDIALKLNYYSDTTISDTIVYDTIFNHYIVLDTIIFDSILIDTIITDTTINDTLYLDTTIIYSKLIDTVFVEKILIDTTILDISIIDSSITFYSIKDTFIFSTKTDSLIYSELITDTLISDTIITDTLITIINHIGKYYVNPIIIDTTKTDTSKTGYALNKMPDNYLIYLDEDYLIIEFNTNYNSDVTLEVFDLTGIKLFSTTYNAIQFEKYILNYKEFAKYKGLYIIRLSFGEKVQTHKILF
ncbi:MAG: carboxypeptidase regulatory-like domain-containing protein, partial [Bacteroidales bacterium]|nr:carboxypeptidase regulatory-like domain-containing protein [Bacteroidales bacterium]